MIFIQKSCGKNAKYQKFKRNRQMLWHIYYIRRFYDTCHINYISILVTALLKSVSVFDIEALKQHFSIIFVRWTNNVFAVIDCFDVMNRGVGTRGPGGMVPSALCWRGARGPKSALKKCTRCCIQLDPPPQQNWATPQHKPLYF